MQASDLLSTHGVLSRLTVLAVCLAFGSFAVANEKARSPGSDILASLKKEAAEEWSAELVWARFVEHLEKLDRCDLLPGDVITEEIVTEEDVTEEDVTEEDVTEEEDPTEEIVTEEENATEEDDHEGHDHEGHDHDADAGGEHPEHPLPDLSRGDPILGILFRMSKDLVRLHAQFDDPELAARTGEKRDAKIEKLCAALRSSDDPFLREYAEQFSARHATEKGDVAAARESLERLVESRSFLGRSGARRDLVEVYRQLGENTLAILEIQFYLGDLAPEQSADRHWAHGQLKEIRDSVESPPDAGPLKDVAHRSRTISTLLTAKKVDTVTQGRQRDVEGILEKIARLLEDEANRCPSCQQKTSQQTGQCKSTCEECGLCKEATRALHQNGGCQVEEFVMSQKPGEKPGEKPGDKPGDKPGPGKKGQKPGDPRGNKPTQTASKDSKLRKGDPGEAHLKALPPSLRDQWGKINDREVQRSLHEMWTRMPVRYRQLVKGYYEDINEIQTSKRGRGAGK